MTDAPSRPRQLSSGGPYEARFGYSRAVRTGNRVLVSGCTSVVDGQLLHPGDAAAQMRVALDTGVGAVISMGGRAEDVVRTRMYVVRRADCEAVGLVHGELFAQVRPAATMVLVSGLIDEAMLVEVELEACVATPEITLPGITKPEMTESELAASPTPSPRPEA